MRDVLDRIDASNNVAVLITSANLNLNSPVLVHLPPVPALQQRICEFGKGHAVALVHLVLNPATMIQLHAQPLPVQRHSRISSQHSTQPHAIAQQAQKVENAQTVQPLRIVQQLTPSTSGRLIAMPLPISQHILPESAQLGI